MAQPSPIFVTPSTTIVKVVPLQTPYTPVILNSYSYAGQVVTVLDGTSSFGVLQTPVVLSTAATSYFSDGTTSTLINQPQGYVTLQAQSPNIWNYLNSFPFRNQYLSAGVLNLTTSTLQVAVLSTLQEYTSSLQVENLIVSGNVSQSSPITINTSVSTLGSVELYSSFTAWGSAFFSSGLSVGGQVRLNSTLQILGSFATPNSLEFLSTTYVSGSVLALGSLSSPLVNLSGSLDTYRLVVQQSTLTSVVGGATLNVNQLLALSTLMAGGDIQSYRTVVNNFSTMSSMAIRDSLAVTATSIVQGAFSTQSVLAVTTLSTGIDTRIQDKLLAPDVYVGGFLTLSSQVSTLDFQANSAFVRGNLQTNPLLTTPTSIQNITIAKSFGIGLLTSLSTTIGGTLSTPSFALIQGALYGESSFRSRFEISTLNSVSTLGDVYVLGAFSTLNDVSISGSLTVYNDLNIFSTSYWNQSNLSASHIVGDLSVLGDLTVTQRLTISSFVLPSSVTANNFQVSSLFVGYKGIVDTVGISTLLASSIATGGVTNAAFTMDMANTLQTYNLSSFLLSTFEFAAQSDGPVSYSTFFQATSSLGVQTIASPNTLDVNTLAYTLSNVYVAKLISTKTLYGDNILGTLYGNGTLLTNVQFPARLSTGLVTTSTIQSKSINASTFLTSTMSTDLFVSYSTLTVNNFSVYGNANQDLFLQSSFLQTITNSSNLVKLNPLYAYGDPAGLVFKQVVINSNLLPNFNTTSYTLGVGNSLRTNFISSPVFSLPLAEYRADIVVTQLAGAISVQNIYVSSGLIGLSSGSLFIPETTQLLYRSTNTIQPSLSTLQFNSTLFVSYDRQAVGVNTFPTYTLDVKGTAYAPSNLLTTTSTIVRDQLTVRQVQTPMWYGTGTYSAGTSSNIRYSYDGETWLGSTESSENPLLPLCNIAYNGGKATIDASNQTQGARTWVATGAISVLYKIDSGPWTEGYVEETVKKTALTNVAFNGEYWVMTSYNPTNVPSIDPVATVMWSTDGTSWSNSRSGGFNWDGLTSFHGGRGIAWNGSLWVAVGVGSSSANSIITSGDGSNWTSAATGGFLAEGGRGVVWTGCNWVAVGGGGYARSFATSSNGIDWPISFGYGFDGIGNAIAWNGSRLVAVGSYSTGYPSILYSDTYGATWQSATGTLFDVIGEQGKTVVWNGSYWLAGGTTGIRKSYDGKTWFQPGTSPSYAFTGLAWSSNALPSLIVGDSTVKSLVTSNITNLYVGVGQDPVTSNDTIVTSSNGITWSLATSGTFWGSGRAVAYNGSTRWVAVGDGAGVTSNILYSGDATNWSNVILPIVANLGVGNGALYSEYGGKNYWTSAHTPMFPGDTTQFYSSNGYEWYASSGDQFDIAAYAVAMNSNNGIYICVGADTTSGNTLRYGTNEDPLNWSSNGVADMFTTAGYGVAVGANLWVSVGEDTGGYTIKYTTIPRTSWSNCTGSVFTVRGYGVAYNGTGLWVAVGDSGGGGGTIKYSTDGIAWSAANSGEFPDKGRGVVYNEAAELWVVTGELDGMSCFKYSGDGSNWSNGTGGFLLRGYGVATSSNVSITSRSYYDQVKFIKNPGPAVLARQATPYISYTSTLLDLNNVVLFDRQANVIVGTSSISLFTSTFYEPGPAVVSGYVSTTGLTLNAGFYLGMQNV